MVEVRRRLNRRIVWASGRNFVVPLMVKVETLVMVLVSHYLIDPLDYMRPQPGHCHQGLVVEQER